jgi:hypothetical protein
MKFSLGKMGSDLKKDLNIADKRQLMSDRYVNYVKKPLQASSDSIVRLSDSLVTFTHISPAKTKGLNALLVFLQQQSEQDMSIIPRHEPWIKHAV